MVYETFVVEADTRPWQYKRSSSVTKQTTLFPDLLGLESGSNRPTLQQYRRINYSLIAHVIFVICFCISASFMFYRLNTRINELEKELSALKVQNETIVDAAASQHTLPSTDNGDDVQCVCAPSQNGVQYADKERDPFGESMLQCCSQDTQTIQSMIDRAVEGKLHERSSVNKGSGHQRYAYAHVIGRNGTTEANNPMTRHITNWHKQAQLLSNVELYNGNIEIEHTGIYFVYSQVYFYKPDASVTPIENATQTQDETPMIHETCRNGVAIMKSAMAHRDYSSKYHGGIFKLKRGDTIAIRVSRKDYHVNFDPRLTFFGVYCIEGMRTHTPPPETSAGGKPAMKE